MPINPGSRLGTYEVISPLGAGGMGEVYRARDARLNRDVALKVLPEIFAADPERLARFEREAQALAALKHPHIATIYGIEEKDGVRALVLELVDGDTLEERLQRGPISVDESVRLARQIADALEAAHEQGIVHRDLKPANIKITPEGIVKVLDFGLAKMSGPIETASGGSTVSLSMSPTMASPAVLTGVSVLMGTAGYMSPEQARGKVADKRSDIWAFGVLLYEMLAGTRAFAGESVTEVAGAVIHRDPDWRAIPAATAAVVRMVVERCLQKDPKQRFRDMGDVRLALDGSFTVAPSQDDRPAPVARGIRPLPIAIAAVATALLTGGAVWLFTRPEPAVRPLTRLDVVPPDPKGLSPFISVSPDGRTVAFLAFDSNSTAGVWVRPLASAESRALATGQQSLGPVLAWSPDSRQLAFYVDGKLKRIDVTGGPAETIAELKNVVGGSWRRDGTILLSTGTTLMRVPASGGTPVEVADASGVGGDRLFPWFLPDGRHFLYLRLSTNESVQGIYVGSLDSDGDQPPAARLVAASHGALYAPVPGSDRGRLLYVRDGLVMAQELDERRLTLAGDPVPLTNERVQTYAVFAAFGVSEDGTFIYRRGGADGVLTAVDRKGARTPLFDGIKEDRARNPRVSPDGRRLALIIDDQLWSYHLDGRPPIKLTFDGVYYTPAWTPDGRQIVVERSGSGQPISLAVVSADGSGTVKTVGPSGHYHPYGWTADGREIVAVRMPEGANGNADLVRFGTAADSPVQEIVATPAFDGLSGKVSPDGRWVAYGSDLTGRGEVWVRSLTGNAAPVRVSASGGFEPIWSSDGRELYYRANEKVMAAVVEAGSEFRFKSPIALFDAPGLSEGQPPSYDVLPDGRFVMFASLDELDAPISVILNWTEMVKRPASAP
jgi:serine/threonine protein kinase